jgi:hypothetical protein
MSFSFPPVTKMFQFTGFPPPWWYRLKAVGSPIRKSSSQCFIPTRRGLSQVIASFVGSGARAFTVRPLQLDLQLLQIPFLDPRDWLEKKRGKRVRTKEMFSRITLSRIPPWSNRPLVEVARSRAKRRVSPGLKTVNLFGTPQKKRRI